MKLFHRNKCVDSCRVFCHTFWFTVWAIKHICINLMSLLFISVVIMRMHYNKWNPFSGLIHDSPFSAYIVACWVTGIMMLCAGEVEHAYMRWERVRIAAPLENNSMGLVSLNRFWNWILNQFLKSCLNWYSALAVLLV